MRHPLHQIYFDIFQKGQTVNLVTDHTADSGHTQVVTGRYKVEKVLTQTYGSTSGKVVVDVQAMSPLPPNIYRLPADELLAYAWNDEAVRAEHNRAIKREWENLNISKLQDRGLLAEEYPFSFSKAPEEQKPERLDCTFGRWNGICKFNLEGSKEKDMEYALMELNMNQNNQHAKAEVAKSQDALYHVMNDVMKNTTNWQFVNNGQRWTFDYFAYSEGQPWFYFKTEDGKTTRELAVERLLTMQARDKGVTKKLIDHVFGLCHHIATLGQVEQEFQIKTDIDYYDRGSTWAWLIGELLKGSVWAIQGVGFNRLYMFSHVECKDGEFYFICAHKDGGTHMENAAHRKAVLHASESGITEAMIDHLVGLALHSRNQRKEIAALKDVVESANGTIKLLNKAKPKIKPEPPSFSEGQWVWVNLSGIMQPGVVAREYIGRSDGAVGRVWVRICVEHNENEMEFMELTFLCTDVETTGSRNNQRAENVTKWIRITANLAKVRRREDARDSKIDTSRVVAALHKQNEKINEIIKGTKPPLKRFDRVLIELGSGNEIPGVVKCRIDDFLLVRVKGLEFTDWLCGESMLTKYKEGDIIVPFYVHSEWDKITKSLVADDEKETKRREEATTKSTKEKSHYVGYISEPQRRFPYIRNDDMVYVLWHNHLCPKVKHRVVGSEIREGQEGFYILPIREHTVSRDEELDTPTWVHASSLIPGCLGTNMTWAARRMKHAFSVVGWNRA
jgi:hypothetical protein